MKVSVITATWNSGKTLCTTLDSVLSQSYPDIEHIIVDGGKYRQYDGNSPGV